MAAAPYRLDMTAEQIAAALGAEQGGDVWPGGGVMPGGYAPVVIRGRDRRRRLVPRQWGVPPPPRGEHSVTHVRNLHSPFWIGTLRHTEFRCLVPATAFYGSGGGTKGWFGVEGAAVFAIAGIWRDSDVASYAMLTTDGDGLYPAEGLTTLLAILRPDDYDLWLSADWKAAQDLVSPARLPLRVMRY
ncbi:SOS response-associated peptidase family protein [Novosphingobium sp.]|uniref:SOS response-associated peptidase family protein n=1 Tax=Novosphingobium sp. TaxID=1874826 RepID=UPI00333FEA45